MQYIPSTDLVLWQRIKTYRDDSLFAPTLPLEALKLLFSMAVTGGIGYHGVKRTSGVKVDFIDVTEQASMPRPGGTFSLNSLKRMKSMGSVVNS